LYRSDSNEKAASEIQTVLMSKLSNQITQRAPSGVRLFFASRDHDDLQQKFALGRSVFLRNALD
jgi:hypothetical protein